mmetsp:Transcript_41689/g.135200  ORF Transcript_41689/g.135200 Transcript_41689/m.135200 type:complete len:261 (-) Transcript_41689:153-935(-)
MWLGTPTRSGTRGQTPTSSKATSRTCRASGCATRPSTSSSPTAWSTSRPTRRRCCARLSASSRRGERCTFPTCTPTGACLRSCATTRSCTASAWAAPSTGTTSSPWQRRRASPTRASSRTRRSPSPTLRSRRSCAASASTRRPTGSSSYPAASRPTARTTGRPSCTRGRCQAAPPPSTSTRTTTSRRARSSPSAGTRTTCSPRRASGSTSSTSARTRTRRASLRTLASSTAAARACPSPPRRPPVRAGRARAADAPRRRA